jgi:hypothetical protein
MLRYDYNKALARSNELYNKMRPRGTSYRLDGNARDQPRGAGARPEDSPTVRVGSSSRSGMRCVCKWPELILNLRTEADEILIPTWRLAAGSSMRRPRKPLKRLDKISPFSPSSSSLGSVNEISPRPSPSGSSLWGMVGWYLMCNGHNYDFSR